MIADFSFMLGCLNLSRPKKRSTKLFPQDFQEYNTIHSTSMCDRSYVGLLYAEGLMQWSMCKITSMIFFIQSTISVASMDRRLSVGILPIEVPLARFYGKMCFYRSSIYVRFLRSPKILHYVQKKLQVDCTEKVLYDLLCIEVILYVFCAPKAFHQPSISRKLSLGFLCLEEHLRIQKIL